jgi:hypothetical protein
LTIFSITSFQELENQYAYSTADIADQLQGAIDDTRDVHRELVFGSFSDEQELLLFSDCLFADEKDCDDPPEDYYVWGAHGLDSLLIKYLNVMDQISRNASSQSADSTLHAFLDDMKGVLEDALHKSSGLYRKGVARVISDEYVIRTCLLLGCIIALLLIYFIGFREIGRRIADESKRTRLMILMIPNKIADKVPAIKQFLEETTNKHMES